MWDKPTQTFTGDIYTYCSISDKHTLCVTENTICIFCTNQTNVNYASGALAGKSEHLLGKKTRLLWFRVTMPSMAVPPVPVLRF